MDNHPDNHEYYANAETQRNRGFNNSKPEGFQIEDIHLSSAGEADEKVASSIYRDETALVKPHNNSKEPNVNLDAYEKVRSQPKTEDVDFKKQPHTKAQNTQATAIASFAQGALSKKQKAEGINKYASKIGDTDGLPNSAFLDDKHSPITTKHLAAEGSSISGAMQSDMPPLSGNPKVKRLTAPQKKTSNDKSAGNKPASGNSASNKTANVKPANGKASKNGAPPKNGAATKSGNAVVFNESLHRFSKSILKDGASCGVDAEHTHRLLSEVFTNCNTAISSIDNIISCMDETPFTNLIASYQKTYHAFAQTARRQIEDLRRDVPGDSLIAKAFLWGNIKLSTLTNKNTSHLAELMLSGANMIITDLIKSLNKNKNASKDAIVLAHSLLVFEEDKAELMKSYL
jgi:hypothetical protein